MSVHLRRNTQRLESEVRGAEFAYTKAVTRTKRTGRDIFELNEVGYFGFLN